MDLISVLGLFFTWIRLVSGEYHCPESFAIHGSYCYHVNNTDTVTWHQARDVCKGMNSTLVTILNQDEESFIETRVQGTYRSLWIGLHDLIGEDHFTWLDDKTPINFTSWDMSQPNNNAENCAVISGWFRNRGMWNDQYCRKPVCYICEKLADQYGCDPGMELFAGHCYNFSGRSVRETWHNARRICQEIGGDLIIVDSEQENNFLIEKMPRADHWIGLNDIKEEGNWRWLDHAQPASWTTWNYGEPQNGGNILADCVALRHQSYKKGRWFSSPCSSNAGYICEKTKPTGVDCEVDWRPYNSSCYLIKDNRTTWSDARSRCQRIGADLIKIDNINEQTYIKTAFTMMSWIGLNDRSRKGVWTWLDENRTPSYLNWDNAQPTGGSLALSQDCVMLHISSHNLGNWSNHVCNTSMGYICEISSSTCPAGPWVIYNDHCYSFNVDLTSWMMARDRCILQNPNSDLAKIESVEEQNFINGKIKTYDHLIGFWVGLKLNRAIEKYTWLDSTSQAQWFNWAAREPKPSSEQSCVVVAGGWSRRGRWDDIDCMALKGYICQKEAVGDSSYYDFSFKNNVYKIVTDKYSGTDAPGHCKEILGADATLLKLDTQEEADRISQELEIRYGGISVSVLFWIGGNPSEPNSYTYWGTPPPTISPARDCLTLQPMRKRVANGWQFTGIHLTPSTCCVERMAICKRKLNTVEQVDYDFMFNGSIYQVIKDKTSPENAASQCAFSLEEAGVLAMIDTLEELTYVSGELQARHQGGEFQYWVYGDPNGNTTDLPYARSPGDDENCSILSRDMPGSSSNKIVMDFTPTRCTGSRRFICERQLALPGLSDSNIEISGSAGQNSDGASNPIAQVDTKSCVGPCIGLAVAFPFAIFIPAIVVGAVIIYCKRNQYMVFGFNKATDEVYLTRDVS